MIKLNVCMDPVAAIRRLADRDAPDPFAATILGQTGGADAVTLSLLPGYRLYTDQEYILLRQLIPSHLNIVMPPSEEVLQRVLMIRPDMATLVPSGYQSTGMRSEWAHAGWPEKDSSGRPVDHIIDALQQERVLVNVLIKPSASEVRTCGQLKADYVHIDASVYAAATDAEQEHRALGDIASAARTASRMNLGVSAGRGVDYRTVQGIAGIAEVEELIAGHAVMARALAVGFERAVRDMIDILRHTPRSAME
jgi:pyridoxine 5-phosphate synthase